MKIIKFAIIVSLTLILTACASTISTTRTSYNVSPTPISEPILVYGIKDALPVNSQNIGTIRIGDSGFSVNCGWEQVIEKAKNACRNMGGNGIQLISVEEPDISSTCYRITANVWKSPQKEYIEKSIEKTGYTEVKLKEEWNSNGIDAVEGIYETIGANQSAKYTVAIKKMNNIEYNIIYLNGALTEYKDIWSAGDLKAKIFKTATPNIYKVDWYMADKSKNSNIYITFEKG